MGGVQHLFHAERSSRGVGARRISGVCVARRNRGGFLVVHRQVRSGRELAAQHDTGRWW